MDNIQNRLNKLGIILPEPVQPVANYVGYVQVGNLVYISGQVPILDGKVQFIGKVGADFNIEEGMKSSRLCGLNVLSQLKAACNGNLDKVKKCVQLSGFVHATSDFKDHPKVINGCSDLMVEVFDDAGQHSRAAVGVSSLPLGVATEVSAIFELSD